MLKVGFGDEESLLRDSVLKIYLCFQHLMFQEEEFWLLQTKWLIILCKVDVFPRQMGLVRATEDCRLAHYATS